MAGEKSHSRRDWGITLIGLLKLVKAAVLIAAGILTLSLVHHDPPGQLLYWAEALGVDPTSRHLHSWVAEIAGVDDRKLEQISLGTFVYAALFLIEGVGLLLQKRWAEYLTLFITSSFIPFEIYELVHDFGIGKVIAIVLNAAAVIYLIFKVRRERHDKATAAAPVASQPKPNAYGQLFLSRRQNPTAVDRGPRSGGGCH